MDERHDPQTNAPDEGELLAAYLAAETDDITSARIERLLRQDPQAITKLDAIASVRARLQRLDDVVPPDGLRERLDARLRAERTHHAKHGDARRAPVDHQSASRVRRWNQRLAPIAAVAVLVLLAVVGGAALLSGGMAGSTDDSAGAAAEGEADAPLSAPRFGTEENEAEAAQQGGAMEQDKDRAVEPQAAVELPRVRTDADIAARLGRRAQRTLDPPAREARLRRRAGMPTAPICVSDIDATAVDLVELDGQPVLAALVADDGGSQVALFDLQACTRLRTFAP
jgi:negative regulator of sigma E activity